MVTFADRSRNRSATPRKPNTKFQSNRKPSKPNASILSFFQVTDKQEGSLFVGSVQDAAAAASKLVATESRANDDLYSHDNADSRFDGIDSPNKRRRFSDTAHISIPSPTAKPAPPAAPSSKPKLISPFIIDSDDDDDDNGGNDNGNDNGSDNDKDNDNGNDNGSDNDKDNDNGNDNGSDNDQYPKPVYSTPSKPTCSPKSAHNQQADETDILSSATVSTTIEPKLDQNSEANVAQIAAICPPKLKHELTSHMTACEDEDLDGTDTENFEGDEMREWRFMKEQARLEAEESGDMTLFYETFGEDPFQEDPTANTCPICSCSLASVSEKEATRHVNSCLDGDPTPLPTVQEPQKAPMEDEEVQISQVGKRFMRAAIPRPGQANPFDLTGQQHQQHQHQQPGAKFAFSQLMSSNAEDSAWSAAAAAETASRGRPAYMRTCPFYKIMPGFSICVDAFRYGAVQGCQAYFLSHFHSDHYIGLTANWAHGPIYCSQVTGSLVRNQLRTAAKWVVELEFNKEYHVPGTDGAKVTMISANHCPGSSMFIFEKAVGDGHGKNVKRILHCGDFRACPDHVQHPLLRPDTRDSVTGKLEKQKIDICYLDTTYLNPRYSFPPQNDVIQACADLCANMSPDPNCKNDIWDSAKKEAGKTVNSYFQDAPATADAEQQPEAGKKLGQRLLVVCGTYSIGKERICVAIAKALRSKIFASPSKMKICKQLGDAELTALLTPNPVEAQVHMQMLMEIRAETLQEYLNGYKPHFSRIVGLRPSGWNFRPAAEKKENSRSVGSGANTAPSAVPTTQILHGKGWRARFGAADFVPQRGSTKEAMCFGMPYSEHSSFRELAVFLMSLRIDKVVPTVNVGSQQSRKRMKGWIDRWMSERRKNGLVEALVEGRDDADNIKVALWDGKSSNGGGAWW